MAVPRSVACHLVLGKLTSPLILYIETKDETKDAQQDMFTIPNANASALAMRNNRQADILLLTVVAFYFCAELGN
jgi:hypothetical protein